MKDNSSAIWIVLLILCISLNTSLLFAGSSNRILNLFGLLACSLALYMHIKIYKN